MRAQLTNTSALIERLNTKIWLGLDMYYVSHATCVSSTPHENVRFP
jgi:hypothetical protein